MLGIFRRKSRALAPDAEPSAADLDPFFVAELFERCLVHLFQKATFQGAIGEQQGFRTQMMPGKILVGSNAGRRTTFMFDTQRAVLSFAGATVARVALVSPPAIVKNLFGKDLDWKIEGAGPSATATASLDFGNFELELKGEPTNDIDINFKGNREAGANLWIIAKRKP